MTDVDELAQLLRETKPLVVDETHFESWNGRELEHDVDAREGDLDRPAGHSWQPIDLVAVGALAPERPTIGSLVYPGRKHLVSGETEALKTWLVLILAAEEINQGRTVMFVDYENGPRDTLARMRDLGLTDQQVKDHVVYVQPDEPMSDPLVLADVDMLIKTRNPTLVVIDAYTGALGTHALDANSGLDIETFNRTVVDPLRSYGAAVVILDHLVKDKERRGRYSIGSERKASAAEVHLGAEVAQPFGRGRSGLLKLRVHKDRGGYHARPYAAQLELDSHPDTGSVTWRIRAAENADGDKGAFRPTFLMERVSRYVEGRVGVPPSRADVERDVNGNAAAKRLAMNLLLAEGYCVEDSGPRNARLLRSNHPYREVDEATSSTSSDLVPTSSETK